MRTTLNSALIAAGLALLVTAAPNSGHAQQIIQGRILQDRTNLPIEQATVTLTNAAGRELDRVQTTNKNGTFIMSVDDPGRYRLRIRRIAFDSVTSEIIELGLRQHKHINFTLTPISVVLAKVIIVERSDLERGRDGMAKREAMGKGTFLYRKDIAEIATLPVYEILGRVKGLETVLDGSLRSLEGHRCLQFLINRLPVTEIPDHDLNDGQTFATFYDMLPNGVDIYGVEIFTSFKDVPPEFRYDAWPADPSIRGVTPVRILGGTFRKQRYMPACGLINVWTSAAW
jgi:hypothetical protein